MQVGNLIIIVEMRVVGEESKFKSIEISRHEVKEALKIIDKPDTSSFSAFNASVKATAPIRAARNKIADKVKSVVLDILGNNDLI